MSDTQVDGSHPIIDLRDSLSFHGVVECNLPASYHVGQFRTSRLYLRYLDCGLVLSINQVKEGSTRSL